MAECNYDEVTHSIYPRENLDPMYHWDAHFPERLSRLHLSLEFSSPVFRRNRRSKERGTGRYKTQPITFDEITEVDEDASGVASTASCAAAADPDICRDAKASFRNQAPAFSRSVDGLVASGYIQAKSGTSTGSDKENTPCDPERMAHYPPGIDENQVVVNSIGALDQGRLPELDATRHRRKRSGRKLRNRNTVPEELPETEKMEESPVVG